MRCTECDAADVSERCERTAQGYRRFRCRVCGRQFNERSGGILNRAQFPSDVIALVVFWRLRYKLSLRDLPEMFGPYTTCYNRFVRWRRAGVWGRIIDALAAAHDASVQMIDTSIVRVHQHGACIVRNRRRSMGRSRGGLTSKIHAVGRYQPAPIGCISSETRYSRWSLVRLR